MRNTLQPQLAKMLLFPLLLAAVWPTLAVNASVYPFESSSTCQAHVIETCQEPGSNWEEGTCNSIHGGFMGNSNGLHQLMQQQFQDSFKILFMGSHFSSDVVNRMGINGLMKGYSDKMWENGKHLVKYILRRGGRMGQSFKVSDFQLGETHEEVEALGAALDIFKNQAGKCLDVHKHAMNKKVHFGSPAQDSYDPAVAHYVEENFLVPYTKDIRTLSGHLNVLAKMARNDKTRAMGLHLFDKSLA